MTQSPMFDLFLPVEPGLEPLLAQEVERLGIGDLGALHVDTGGVGLRGTLRDVWALNLHLRGAQRVLVRIGAFRAPHLAQLDKRARKLPWADLLRRDVPVRVEATCRKSKIYHQKAAAQRITVAIQDAVGAPLATPETEGPVVAIKARIEDDLCTISLDSSGAPLHRRGHKTFVGKAPMRETLASLFLAACDHRPGEPVVDPMCGSGTFVLEAAEKAMGLAPGRGRDFTFEMLAGFDRDAWDALRADDAPKGTPPIHFGYDRDDGAIRGATANGQRAGVAEAVTFTRQAISDLTPPEGPPGLVITNPPYGGRIGQRKLLFALYGTLGKVLSERFTGWRVGIVTGDPGLAKATGLPFQGPPLTLPHGGLTVGLHRTGPLGPYSARP